MINVMAFVTVAILHYLPKCVIEVVVKESPDSQIFPILSLLVAIIASIVIPIIVYSKTNKQFFENFQQSQQNFQKQLVKDRHQLAVNTVTSQRVNWIYEMRNAVTEYVECASEIYSIIENTNYNVTIKRLEFSDCSLKLVRDLSNRLNGKNQKLVLLLNFQDDIDRVMINCINVFNITLVSLVNKSYDKTEADGMTMNLYEFISCLSGHTRIYLKLEWNRVRKEAENDKYTKLEYEKDRYALYESYLGISGSQANEKFHSTNECENLDNIIGVNELLQYWYKHDVNK